MDTSTENEIIVPDFGNMTADVIRELTTGRLYEAVQAKREQREIAGDEQVINGRKHLRFGRMVARISETAYDYWGQRLGYDCWKDKAFLREFLRDNPGARVDSRPANATIRVTRKLQRPGMPRGTILDRTGAAIA